MARLTDHDVRDAEHAARLACSEVLGKYQRRIAEMSKALIQEAIERAAEEGNDDIDGAAIGREAAHAAIAPYFPDQVPKIIDAPKKTAKKRLNA